MDSRMKQDLDNHITGHYGEDQLEEIYAINLQGTELYWSNEFGWVDSEQATIFSAAEHTEFNLPINGIWERW